MKLSMSVHPSIHLPIHMKSQIKNPLTSDIMTSDLKNLWFLWSLMSQISDLSEISDITDLSEIWYLQSGFQDLLYYSWLLCVSARFSEVAFLQDSQLTKLSPFSWQDFVEYNKAEKSGRSKSRRKVTRPKSLIDATCSVSSV